MGRHNKFGTGGTGQHFKTKVKEAYQINKAAEKGKIDGAAIAHRKKGWQDSLREHLGKAIDRIDPIDGAIMAALAYLSYEKNGPADSPCGHRS